MWIRGRRPVPPVPAVVPARTVPRVLWVVMGVGAAAVLALAVLAGVWAWQHPVLAGVLAFVAGWAAVWLAGRARGWWDTRG